MEQVRRHFENEAPVYDRLIETLIPGYREMVSALVDAIHFDQDAPIRVLDVGCGTGTLSRAVLNRFSSAHITALDFSESMIAQARNNLEGTGIRFLLQDFSIWDWDQSYDVVISSLALHHLRTDEDKKKFYRKCYQSLSEGGVFCNADIVLAADKLLQKKYLLRWKTHMLQSVTGEEYNRWMVIYQNEDVPVRMSDHLDWMAEAGFKHLDIIWKYYNFAVYCGYKRS